MKIRHCVLLLILLLRWRPPAVGADDLTVVTLPLEDVVKIRDQSIGHARSVDIQLPPFPARPGRIVVLRFRAFSFTPHPAGWNWNLMLALNGARLEKDTQSGALRLIGRKPSWRARGRDWQLFSGFMIRTMFAPDVQTADSMTPDVQGASFALNISDIARGVDGNALRISNMRRTPSADPKRDLIVRDIEIGWLNRSLLPKPPNRVPTRGPIRESVSAGGLRLAQGTGGGFSLRSDSGVELLVETALAMDRNAPSALIAGDVKPAGVNVKIERSGPRGYRVAATWRGIVLARRLRLEKGLLCWKERWTNVGKRIVGIPFQHRLFLKDDHARFWLGGNRYSDNVAGCATNPTMFLAPTKAPGSGAGVTLESDWLRLLARMRRAGGVGDIYSVDLALPPGGSIDFTLTVQFVENGDGYWTFINDVRRRWGVNGTIAHRPFFWNWAGHQTPANPRMTAEQWRKALGPLGPVAALLWFPQPHPILRLGVDVATVTSGRYPKLPASAPRAPGGTPDLDLDAFLTFKHREPFWKEMAAEIRTAHRALPDMRVIVMAHPAFECVYAPAADRWPNIEDVLRARTGRPFDSNVYSSRIFRDWVERGWKAMYFVPRPGSDHLRNLLDAIRRALDACGADGVYVDEFCWAGTRRDYSRYDYSRWDGHSADLDENGEVVRLKCDNGFMTESAQMQIIDLVRRRGKFFFANGGPTLRSVVDLHPLCFNEGGQGTGAWAGVHLTAVPMILGNFGDQGETRKGVFESVKAVLENGCLYSPKECNLVLDGPDNFVCKQFPISIRRIGPGVIVGDQRLVTLHSGRFDWPGRACVVAVYAYDQNGELLNRGHLPKTRVARGERLKVTVPKGGLVIAEVEGARSNRPVGSEQPGPQ